MADEPKDYYDIIREKITDPEIQKALDAFHARGVAEQQAKQQDNALRGEPRIDVSSLPVRDSLRAPVSEPVRPTAPEGVRPPAAAGERAPRPDGLRPSAAEAAKPLTADGMRRPMETDRLSDTGARTPSPTGEVPNNGPLSPGAAAPQARDPSVFRRYMQSANRPSVYSDAAADDAYSAAYRDAMRKASGEHGSEHRGQRAQFVMGVLVILFAVFGLGCAVFFSVKGVSSLRARRQQDRCAAYNTRLISVAAVDPDAFDDISAARMDDLIKIAVWRLIGSGVDPNRYVYANGELCLPQADVEAAYTACFGTQRPIVHQTAEGYGYSVQYSAEDAAYFIPMTTLEPIYTPKVVSVETKGGAAVVTCGLVSGGLWKQDRTTGDITPPEPDKYIRVTFRTASGAEYISSLQSLGLPETALPSGNSAGQGAAPETPTAPQEETTTGKQIVITWD